MSRKLADWVEGFVALTETSGSPERLRRWAGITCLAGVLERKVWVFTAGANLYPNLYTFLVSPPGVGKSRVLNEVYGMWRAVPDHYVAAPNVSKASLIDELADASRAIIRPGCTPSTVEFNSLKILASELGVFLPEFANEFMNTLTDIYDCYPYSERKRTKNLQINIPKPQINLLAGTTPNYLSNLLPDGAWDQGFLSRTILVFAADKKLESLFATKSTNGELRKKLQDDLDKIGEVYGEISFTEEAAAMLDEWHLGGQHPAPDHPKLTNYLTRRTAHLLKLCMVSCFNSSEEKVITVPHVQTAMDWLFDAETSIPEIFKAMASGGDAAVMEECWHFLFKYKAKFRKGAPHALVIKFLTQRIPTHSVERLLDLMEKANMIRPVTVKGEGLTYEAKAKELF